MTICDATAYSVVRYATFLNSVFGVSTPRAHRVYIISHMNAHLASLNLGVACTPAKPTR